MKCDTVGCDKNATHQVKFSLAVNKSHTPAISTPILRLCSEHKKDVKKEEFFTGPQWDKLCKAFTDIGKLAPTKEFSELVIEPIPGLN